MKAVQFSRFGGPEVLEIVDPAYAGYKARTKRMIPYIW